MSLRFVWNKDLSLTSHDRALAREAVQRRVDGGGFAEFKLSHLRGPAYVYPTDEGGGRYGWLVLQYIGTTAKRTDPYRWIATVYPETARKTTGTRSRRGA